MGRRRRITAPTLDASQRHLLAKLDTLDALASYLLPQDERRRALLWAAADILAAWVASRTNGGSVAPLYRALAQATGWSSRFVRDLVRTARAFPPEARARYADKAWQWCAECLREGDPLGAAERYERPPQEQPIALDPELSGFVLDLGPIFEP